MKKSITMVLAILFSLYSFGQVGRVFTSGSLKYKITAATTVEVSGKSGTTGGLTIPSSVVYNSASYSVTSIGSKAFDGDSTLTSVTIPNSINSIGDYTFLLCSGLTSITIPNSVTSIGAGVFEGCSILTSVTIPNSVTSIGNNTFSRCSGLTSVTIPNSVTSIGKYTFSSCSGLTSITIPTSVTTIGDRAFSRSGLTLITIPNSVLVIGESAFSYCNSLNAVSISSSVTSIGFNAFFGSTNLTSVTVNWTSPLKISDKSIFTDLDRSTIALFVPTGSEAAYQSSLVWKDFSPIAASVAGKIQVGQQFVVNGINYVVNKETIPYEAVVGSNKLLVGATVIPPSISYNGNSFIVTAIRNYAFESCTGLTTITIPNSITSIGKNAFAHCHSLASVSIPNSVTSIGKNAFYFCYGLKSVTIPNSVTNIEDNTFDSCRGMTSVTIPNSVTSIGVSAFAGCHGLTSVTIPNTVTSIGAKAFDGCYGLTSVTVPNSITSIEYGTFADCFGLTLVTIPNSVTTIADSAFNNCQKLSSVTVPNSVISIGHSAFADCYGLTSVTIPDSVMVIGNEAFVNCTSLKAVNVNWITPLNIDRSVFSKKEEYPGAHGSTQVEFHPYGFEAILYVPAGTAANYKVAAVWQYFGSILEPAAAPTITTFLPSTAATGATITITGTNFTGATAVSFGGIAATSFTVVNDTTITAVVGSGASGNVSITTPGGTATKVGFVINSIPTNGLIAWYPFNGNTLDNSGNNHNGVNTGATLTTDRFGNASSAYNFSGSNQFITCPNIPALNGLANATFSLWVKVNGKNAWDNGTNVNNAMFFLSRDRDIAPGYIGMYFSPNTQTFASGFRSGTGVGLGTTLKYPVPQPAWHHISFTLGGGFFKFYVDGELVGTTPFTAPLATSSGAINLGKLPVGSFEYYLNGVLDDVAIYGRTLDTNEIKALYDLSGSLAVNKFDNKAFAYYPNPVSDELNLSYSYGLTSVKVTDIMGRQLYFKKLNENAVKVDMSSMVRGVYFVEVTSDNSSKTIKVIKNNN